ncbi:hypothetical protein EPICR_20216 [Candidatus Desulfarcum epimagneticum]|uniref:AAA+ ATPase domain-containing protein n=1 Tax=uncultured Desulfobacteraceae bacterium TaxID=218296 RepID=A0A484HEP1_9BACT|nr:hypothetical protein EPICR_20216 [uncultured Desulfobacteraceae bacterium]
MTRTTFITFYSYKGGVGRTLALGNVAWEAALNGKKVVIIDFDLEAPGIPSLIPFRDSVQRHLNDERKKGGIFEFVKYFKEHQTVPPLSEYYSTEPILSDDFKKNGNIIIIPAGYENSDYKETLQSFDWKKFYEKEDGKELFAELRQQIEFEFKNPDFILIDSRTGLTDIGAISTFLLPDQVVILTGLNDQNIYGCKSVIESIDRESRRRAEENWLRPIDTILAATPVNDSEELRLRKKRLGKAAKELGRKIDVILPYVPILSLEERILTREESGERDSPIPIVREYRKLYALISNKTLHIYFNWIQDRYSHMDAEKLHGKGQAVPLKLPEIFVPLYAYDPARPATKKTVKDPGAGERQEPVDVEKLMAQNDFLLIEGIAGSGKTTVLKHAAYCLAAESANGCGATKSMNGFAPILILLKDVNDYFKDLGPRGRPGDAESVMAWYFRKKTGSAVSIRTANDFIKAGKALILLDGLDELNPRFRNHVVDAFADLRVKHKGVKLVLTGRPHSMEGAAINRLGERHARILAFDRGQIKTYIRRWFEYLYGGSPGIGEMNADAMINEVAGREAISKLSENPLMLTAICILYHDGKELPEQRAELYKKFIDNLLFRRFGDPEKVHNFLKAFAHGMQMKRRRGAGRAFAIKTLKEVYRKRPDETARDYDRRIDETFDDLEPKCGLLKLENGEYAFQNLTFQKFLTAHYLVNRNKGDFSGVIQNLWGDEWHREVIELYIGFLNIDNKETANLIVEKALDKKDTSPYKRWRTASRSFHDIHRDRRDAPVLEKTRGRLIEIMGAEPDPKIRAEAGDILGWLGDPRDLKEFIRIKGGLYDLKDLGEHQIRNFEIGRYPVVNAWFGEFINAGGYENRDFWTPEGWKWREYENVTKPLFWDDRKWRCPNAPVVGVSWYEAAAFVQWLNQTGDDDYTHNLLTEKQWQAAAGGFGKRTYPWGDEWDKNKCNNKEIKIQKTTSVGIFKTGGAPEGVFDLSGNVWEWTTSNYHSKNELADFVFDKKMQKLLDEAERSRDKKLIDDFYKKLGEKKRRLSVLRGGSWIFESFDCRCAARFLPPPDFRFIDSGFRCARTRSM